MNYVRMLLAALGAMVAYFAFGGLAFALLPGMKDEFSKYPNVYRPRESMSAAMPIGMAGIFLGILAVSYLYATTVNSGGGPMAGLKFGMLIGIFVVCAFVLHNHMNLNIGWKMTLMQSVAYFAEWTVVGLVIGLIYK
jgi:hypothetical protein